MRRLAGYVAFIILISVNLSGCWIQAETKKGEIAKYTMYIGLNDKDTYTQMISYEDAEKKVSDIALKYVDGFTVLSAKGAYKDDKEVITYENSLVIQFLYVSDEQMKSIMDEVLIELNQNSILLEKQTVECDFYEGVEP